MNASTSSSKTALWTGRVLTALCALFLLLDGVAKLFKPAVVVQGTVDLGYPASTITGMGLALVAGVVLHLIPRTAVLGALLVTAYLGGAVATHVRVENPLFSHVLFPTYLAIMLWAGLGLRRPAIRALLLRPDRT
ncbi:MAG TPA: DoxX family protein [Lacunisphaera sp.]